MSDLFDDPAFDDAPRGIPFYRTRSVGDTLSDTFDFFKQNGREYGWGIIVLVAPLVAANVAVSVLSGAQAQAMEALANLPALFSGEAVPEALGAEPSMALVGVSYVVGWLAFSVMLAGTLAYLRLYESGQAGAISPGVLWEGAKPLVVPMLGVVAGSFLLVVLLALVNVIPCLGQIAFLAGLLFLLPILWMWPAARAFDADGVGSALSKARERMRGQWGPSLLAAFLIGLVVVVLAMLVSIPFFALTFALGGMFSGVLMAFSTALGLAFYPLYGLPVIAAALHYFNLVERADAVGLASRVNDLDDAGTPDAPPAW